MEQAQNRPSPVTLLNRWRENVMGFAAGGFSPPYLPVKLIWVFLFTGFTQFVVILMNYSPQYWNPQLSVKGIAPANINYETTPLEWILYGSIYISLALFCLIVFNYRWSLSGWFAFEVMHLKVIANWLDGCNYSRWSLTLGRFCESFNETFYWVVVAFLLGLMMIASLHPNEDSIPRIQIRRKAPIAFIAASVMWSAFLVVGIIIASRPPETGWRQLDLKRNPSPLDDAVYAYDTDRNVLVVFGGTTKYIDGRRIYTHQTWEWDGEQWKDVSLSEKDSPEMRINSAMAYDKNRDVMVMYGGYGKNDAFLCSTWEWDGKTWIGRCPPTCPGARAGHVMYFDPVRGHVMLYGGYDSEEYFNDLWEWDGETWTEIKLDSTAPTSIDLSLAYNINDDLLFGLASGTNNSAWSFKDTVWSRVNSNNLPKSREGGRLVFDPTRKRYILFGGEDENEYLNDTWIYNGSTWDRLNDSLFTPSVRTNTILWYDETRQRVMLFGGNYGTTIFNDTWELVTDKK